MFESEKASISSENEPFVKGFLEEQKYSIESLLADADKRLGEGRTAYVSFLGPNNKVCMKVYKKPEDIIGADFYLTPSKEKVFLEKLKNLGAKVRVPKVYVSYENGDAGYDFLMMESLPAVSIDDVLQGRAELPKNFDLASFRDDLNDFVERMHSENIYHRDLHEGNIMIDKETCQPYVIDFGAAAEFYGQIEIGERGPYHITKDGREIILTSDEAMVRSIVKKINGMLTRTH